MRFSNLTLPPLVVILLLVFLWVILLVLLLWAALRPRRTPDPQETPLESPQEDNIPRRPVRVVRPQVVREVRSGNTGEGAHDDAFDDFMNPGNRRDDFDF